MAEEITCLGKNFASEDERREYFRNELRKKLPELKQIDGFPIGEDEDIIALSDPPYYTACPNPWLNNFIDEWENEKEQIKIKGKVVREPYAFDISEGKNNPIYNAHTYHTKVPHPAIMRYLFYYTNPGDIIFDGFAGTGMTGVAAQACNSSDGIFEYQLKSEFEKNGYESPIWGFRRAICGDLSPIASFIAHNYNNPVDIYEFEKEAKKILLQVNDEFSWMYETHDKIGKGIINYIVWSDVFLCSECGGEIVFFDQAVDINNLIINDEFKCPICNAIQTKRSVEKAVTTFFDKALNQTVTQTKSVPVLINYTRQGKRFEKKPEKNDYELLRSIDEMEFPYWIPTDKLPQGYNTKQPIDSHNFTHVHHFYTKRNLIYLSAIRSLANNSILIWLTSSMIRTTKLYKFTLDRKMGTVMGTLYIPSLWTENSPKKLLESKINDFKKAFALIKNRNIVFQNSATSLDTIRDNSIDYIFTDPPFGANIMYSELNFIWESWLKVKTNQDKEAISNPVQGKNLFDYQKLIYQCFSQYYRILKPNKWMTVEFSNTNAHVWNGIQSAIQKAGFIISSVTALDKKQGTFKAVTTPTAVKQDLIISCYKPSDDFINKLYINEDINIWDFVSEHLIHLPIHLKLENNTTIIVERNPKILYDRLVSYYLIKGLPVSINSKEFQEGLKQRFIERDGMYFTVEQAIEYEKKKASAPNIIQTSWQVATEFEGIEWLKRELLVNNLKYQDIQPKWMQATTAIRKGDILPELREILQQNFIEEPDGSWRVPDMNEAKDREIIRNKSLLKEFNDYMALANNPKAKRMKEVRVESLRAGFKHCWDNKDFKTIVIISDKIPQNLILEDEQLLMYYDIAKDRV